MGRRELPQEQIRQTLQAAGCEGDAVDRFLVLWRDGHHKAALSMLCGCRRTLLDTIHRDQKMLDQMDYLIYALRDQAARPD